MPQTTSTTPTGSPRPSSADERIEMAARAVCESARATSKRSAELERGCTPRLNHTARPFAPQRFNGPLPMASRQYFGAPPMMQQPSMVAHGIQTGPMACQMFSNQHFGNYGAPYGFIPYPYAPMAAPIMPQPPFLFGLPGSSMPVYSVKQGRMYLPRNHAHGTGVLPAEASKREATPASAQHLESPIPLDATREPAEINWDEFFRMKRERTPSSPSSSSLSCSSTTTASLLDASNPHNLPVEFLPSEAFEKEMDLARRSWYVDPWTGISTAVPGVPNSLPMIRIDNIAQDCSVDDIVQWLPTGALPAVIDFGCPIILLDSAEFAPRDGETKKTAWIVCRNVEVAEFLHHKKSPSFLAGRKVFVRPASQGEVLQRLFPAYAASRDNVFDNISERGLVDSKDLDRIVQSFYKEEGASWLPFYRLAAIISFFPFRLPSVASGEQVDALFERALIALHALHDSFDSLPWTDDAAGHVANAVMCGTFTSDQKGTIWALLKQHFSAVATVIARAAFASAAARR